MSRIINCLLVIQDNDLRQLYHEILINEHWEVTVAGSIADALVQLILHQNFGLIIVDGQLPSQELLGFLKVLASKKDLVDKKLAWLDNGIEPLPKAEMNNFKNFILLDTHILTPPELIKKLKSSF